MFVGLHLGSNTKLIQQTVFVLFKVLSLVKDLRAAERSQVNVDPNVVGFLVWATSYFDDVVVVNWNYFLFVVAFYYIFRDHSADSNLFIL